MAKSIIWKNCPAEIEEEKRKVFGPESNQLNGIISVPYGIHAAQNMEKVVKKIIDFELRPDDIWIVTYPKCGTTLTQVLVSGSCHIRSVEIVVELGMFVFF